MEGNPYNLIAFQDEVYTENAALHLPTPTPSSRSSWPGRVWEEPVEVQP